MIELMVGIAILAALTSFVIPNLDQVRNCVAEGAIYNSPLVWIPGLPDWLGFPDSQGLLAHLHHPTQAKVNRRSKKGPDLARHGLAMPSSPYYCG